MGSFSVDGVDFQFVTAVGFFCGDVAVNDMRHGALEVVKGPSHKYALQLHTALKITRVSRLDAHLLQFINKGVSTSKVNPTELNRQDERDVAEVRSLPAPLATDG